MITISLCMIVKDEEAVLGRCLDCASRFVDEIVVVDTGSTDRTMEIAGQYTANLFSFPWTDNFSQARNFAFSKATKDYILWLDADDVVDEDNIRRFLMLKQTLSLETDVVMMKYDIGFDQGGHVNFSYYRERLVRNGAGFYWEEPVHEYIVTWGNYENSDISILHKKMGGNHSTRNLDIYRKQIAFGNKLSPRATYYFARELMTHGLLEEATQHYKQFLQLPDIWTEDAIGAAQDLSDCLVLLGDADSALDVLFGSFSKDLPRAGVLCRVGSIYLDRGDFYKAIFWYSFALEVPRPDGWGFCAEDEWGFIPHMQLCVLYDKLGQRAEAIFHHKAAEAIKPTHPSVLYNIKYFGLDKANYQS